MKMPEKRKFYIFLTFQAISNTFHFGQRVKQDKTTTQLFILVVQFEKWSLTVYIICGPEWENDTKTLPAYPWT